MDVKVLWLGGDSPEKVYRHFISGNLG